MVKDLSPYIAKFEEFFEEKYMEQIEELAVSYPTKRSLNIDYANLEKYDPDLADELITAPEDIIEAAKQALLGMKILKLPETKFEINVRFFNLPDTGLLIQDIGAQQIGKLITVTGIITKRAEVRPRVHIAVLRCVHCDAVYKIPISKKVILPEVCEGCKRRGLKQSDEESYFVDLQKAEAQELLERLKGGAPASHIELWLEDDLVNTIIPGDNVQIVGILKIRPPLKGSGPQYSKYIEVSHVQKVQKEFEEVELTKEDVKKILELAKDPNIYEKIVASIAPSIYGHEEVKEAIMLQLFGGAPNKELPDGGKIRCDLHLLLIGDPGAAKTRFLQYVVDLAPKSVYVSGKSVTGTGLTASAEKDELGEGGWTLKAGALVLSSGGLAAIDEFDKIEQAERAALHEVMESQSISVAKAGIVAKFRAKTSILAAANPEFGRFDPNKLPADQFRIPPTLLSRFDLIFPIKDVMDEEKDKKLAEHILSSHKSAGFRARGKKVKEMRKKEVSPIDRELLRKYIAYSRKNIYPLLTTEANERIKGFYVELRKLGAVQGAVPITPRQIEGLIRLSEASAKVRLSDKVEIVDAERAIKLTNFVLHQVYMDKETKRIDIDIIATGQPKSKVDKFHTVLDIIQELQKKYDLVETKKVIEEAKEYDIDEWTARRFIEELLRSGELLEPKHGYIKLIKRFG